MPLPVPTTLAKSVRTKLGQFVVLLGDGGVRKSVRSEKWVVWLHGVKTVTPQ
jgi:hypothetical protein